LEIRRNATVSRVSRECGAPIAPEKISMRFARPALSAAIVGLAIAVAWHDRPAPQPIREPGEVADSAPTQAATAQDAATSGAVVDALADVLTSPATPVATATANAPTPAPAPLPGETPATPMAQILEAWRHVPPERRPDPERIRTMERAFAAEPIDAAWASGAEADLLGKIAQTPGLALTGLLVECRSTMCRMQLAVPAIQGARQSAPINFEQTRDFAASVGLELAQSLGGSDPSGTLQFVTYLRRKGPASEQPR
jgi:hypothetical protein